MVDIEFVGKSYGLDKNDYVNLGISYAWFLTPKIKYCLVIDDFGVILAKRTFEAYSEEHRMMRLDKFISFSEGKAVSGRFSIDWSNTFEGIKIPHRKQDCSDCSKGKTFGDCVIKPKMNCSNYEMEKACKTCLDRISQKKTNSTDNNKLKRKPANEKYQMLLYYQGKYEHKLNNKDIESAKQFLLTAEKAMIEKRRFERIKML